MNWRPGTSGLEGGSAVIGSKVRNPGRGLTQSPEHLHEPGHGDFAGAQEREARAVGVLRQFASAFCARRR
jgi:hypothetical protein